MKCFSERSGGAGDLPFCPGYQAEGWSAVAEGIQSHPGVVKLFSAPKEAMDEASREDLRKIWDAQHGTWDLKL